CLLNRSVFFSSRRRHTRFSRDWSSDVCSSDLHVPQVEGEVPAGVVDPAALGAASRRTLLELRDDLERLGDLVGLADDADEVVHRSEERRVGQLRRVSSVYARFVLNTKSDATQY